MRSAEIVPGGLEDRRHAPLVTTLFTPESVGRRPVAYLPHPPRRHEGSYQQVRGYPTRPPAGRSAGTALMWTLLFGPLGLCYLSTGAGIAATGLTVGILLLSGSAAALAVIWPVAMLLSLLYASGR